MAYIGDAGDDLALWRITDSGAVHNAYTRKFLEYKDINIESLFLFKDGQWHVKSRHVKGGDKEWDLA